MYLLDLKYGRTYLQDVKDFCARIGPILGVNFVVKHVPCPQQFDDSDCGIMVIGFTKWIANRFVDTNTVDPLPIFNATDAAVERIELRQELRHHLDQLVIGNSPAPTKRRITDVSTTIDIPQQKTNNRTPKHKPATRREPSPHLDQLVNVNFFSIIHSPLYFATTLELSYSNSVRLFIFSRSHPKRYQSISIWPQNWKTCRIVHHQQSNYVRMLPDMQTKRSANAK